MCLPFRCTILSLQYYNEESLSVLFQYSFEAPKYPSSADSTETVTLTHSAVAQLPIGGVVSSRDSSGPYDVQPLLTQLHTLGSFKAGGLAVSGSRKTAAVVSGGREGGKEGGGRGREAGGRKGRREGREEGEGGRAICVSIEWEREGEL